MQQRTRLVLASACLSTVMAVCAARARAVQIHTVLTDNQGGTPPAMWIECGSINRAVVSKATVVDGISGKFFCATADADGTTNSVPCKAADQVGSAVHYVQGGIGVFDLTDEKCRSFSVGPDQATSCIFNANAFRTGSEPTGCKKVRFEAHSSMTP